MEFVQKRVKPTFADKNCGKDQTSFEKKLANLEAELDGLRVEITIANDTNEYLDEQNNLLREVVLQFLMKNKYYEFIKMLNHLKKLMKK